jgi:hypothetical protein
MVDEEENGSTNDSMPPPPDLSALFQQHTAKINDACQQATKAFEAIKTRDQKVEALTQSLTQEVNQVFMLAAAAKTPQLAMLTIQPVLAAANLAFAQVPTTEQSSISSLQSAFKTISE